MIGMLHFHFHNGDQAVLFGLSLAVLLIAALICFAPLGKGEK